tara:strand:+ start:123 stop:335 length:213 start_codon:yes stop_codon:yes gene_type:complete
METFSKYWPEITAVAISILALLISGYFSWRSHKRGKLDQKLNQEQLRKIKEASQKAYDQWIVQQLHQPRK